MFEIYIYDIFSLLTPRRGAYEAANTISAFLSKPVMKAASPAEPVTRRIMESHYSREIIAILCITGKVNLPCSGVPNKLFALVEIAAYSPSKYLVPLR